MNIFEKVKKLNLPFGKYVVLSGSALEGYGIRKSGDVDILVTTDVYEDLKSREGWLEHIFDDGRRVVTKEDYEIGDNFYVVGKYEPTREHLIQTATIIQGVPFMSIEEVLKFKKSLMRDKDVKDIALIEKYLEERNF